MSEIGTKQSEIQTGKVPLPESQAGAGALRRPDGMSDADWQQQLDQQESSAAGADGGIQGGNAEGSGYKDAPSNT